jgi:uncharacterized protein YbjT (DUF2867 family)
VHRGNLEEPDTLAPALDGVEQVYVVIPPKMQTDDWRAWQREIADNVAATAAEAGVDRAVLLSSAAAQYDDVGPISGLGEVEERLADALPHTLALRAGYFMENFMQFVPSITEEQTIYHAFPPDWAWPMVATRDIGDIAAERLLDDTWSGHQVQGVHGPGDLTHAQAADVIGEVLGTSVEYVEVPVDAVEEQMRESGMSVDVAANYREMITGMAAHTLDEIEDRTAETTTPTTMEAFAREVLKPAIDAEAQQAGT